MSGRGIVSAADGEGATSRVAQRWTVLLAAVALALVGMVAYYNSLSAPFVFDDESSILTNASLRRFWSWAVLAPPAALGETVGGRPLLNLSFAANYAVGGTAVRGYHVVNLAIHALAALTLFGLVRRTLLRLRRAGRWTGAPTAAAFAIALWWVVHPLQTEAVTYTAQRAESLCGLLYLLTLYGFVRAIDSTRAAGWLAVSAAASAAGMATKEVMVTAPFMVALYDWTFVAESAREILRRRWRYYLALALGWLLLAGLLLGTGGRGGSAGFGHGVSAWQYGLIQCRAVAHYLWLAVWPHLLVFDYGPQVAPHLPDVWPQTLLLLSMLAGTGYALWRRSVWGFLGAWFFVILAPTSSIVPVADPVFEHRMYLPLAAVLAAAVVGVGQMLGGRGWRLIGAVAIVATALTASRNHDYRSGIALWRDTIEKRPANPRAWGNLGTLLVGLNRASEAVPYFEGAVRLTPGDSVAQHNLGNALALAGRPAEAIAYYEQALRLNPRNANAQFALAQALVVLDRLPEAIPHFEEAARLAPNVAFVRIDFSRVLLRVGRMADGEAELREALRLDPSSAEAHINLGQVFLLTRRADEAVPHFEAALQLAPETAATRAALGAALALTGRNAEARTQLERALVLDPANALARQTLGLLPASKTR